MIRVFVSSVQKEFAKERRALKRHIEGDALPAEPLYLTKYIERMGTGIRDMIADCQAARLPEPTFAQDGTHFVTTIWRDWLTDAVMDQLGLNERQKKGVAYVKSTGKISNPEYQKLTDCTKKTATRDSTNLKEHIFRQVGVRGPGVHYVLRSKKDIMGT